MQFRQNEVILGEHIKIGEEQFAMCVFDNCSFERADRDSRNAPAFLHCRFRDCDIPGLKTDERGSFGALSGWMFGCHIYTDLASAA